MAELSTAATSRLLEWLCSQSIPAAVWTADICQPEDLIEPGGFVEWGVFSQLCDRLVEFSEEPSDGVPGLPLPAEIARELAEEAFAVAPERFRTGDIPIEILFVEEALSIADEVFPGLEVHAKIASDGEVVLLEIQLPEDAAGCPTFFELIRGILEAAPALLGQRPTDVAAEIHPERARYAVRLPTNPGAAITPGQEIEQAQEETPPRIRAERRGDALFDDHNAFIQSLALCTDLDELGEHLFALLRQHFRCVASRVWLDSSQEALATNRDEADPARFEFGKSKKPPSHSLRLGVGDNPIGRLDIWNVEALHEEELGQLENLIPWYALSISALRARERPATTTAAAPTASATASTTTSAAAPVNLARAADAAPLLERVAVGDAIDGDPALVTLAQVMVENANELVAEISPASGSLEISANVSEFLGHTPEAFATASYRELLHADDLPRLEQRYNEVQSDRASISASLRLRHADGRWRWFDATAQSYETQSGEVKIVVVAHDSAGHTGIEQERTLMTSIVQNSSNLIALTSLNGDVLFLNDPGLRLLGLRDLDEARTRSIYDFIDEDNARAATFDIMPTVHRLKRWSGELRFRRSGSRQVLTTQSTIFVVDDHRTQRPCAIAFVSRDISDREESERALLESKERYRMLAENPHDLVMELDDHGDFIYASPNFETILGHLPEALLGSCSHDLSHPEDRERIEQAFSKTLAELGTSRGSLRVLDRNGSCHWLDTTVRAYRTADSQLRAVLISRDITEQVTANEALQETEQKLQQSQKMEAVGRMAGGIAHDFNNLLTAITGYCDLLFEDLGPKHPARGDAEEILKAADRASALTHQLLAFSRRQVLKPQVLDLNNLVADMDRMIRRLIGEDIELVTLLDGAAWPVEADPGQLQQVLLNLVVNSRDAMPQGGRITIETENVTLEEAKRTGTGEEIPAGEYLSLRVADMGLGMLPEIRDMIFEPFFTTKESGKGTGLGLSTVIGIVQQSGGHIEVESVPARGSRFAIYLPRVAQVAMLPEQSLAPVQFRGDETILVVEDSEQVLKLVGRCFARHGYTVLEAASGAEALHHGDHYAGPIQLVLCDVILPRMNGFEVMKRFHQLRPETKVIYMSGFTDDSLTNHGIQIQDITLIEKPFAPSTMLRAVRESLDADALPAAPAQTTPDADS